MRETVDVEQAKAHYIAAMISLGLATDRVFVELAQKALVAAGKYIEALAAERDELRRQLEQRDKPPY